MPTIQDILATKGRQIHTVPPSTTVLDATLKMNEHGIGSLVVYDGERVAGIVTERDVLRRIVAEQRSPQTTLVRDIMSHEVICCPPDMDIEEASGIMRDRRIRHLPVCEGDGKLVGLISIGDLNACYASTQEATILFLHDYIYGRV